MKTPDTPLLRTDPETYEVLKAGLHELELRFTRPRDLEDPRVGTLFVVSGQLLARLTWKDPELERKR